MRAIDFAPDCGCHRAARAGLATWRPGRRAQRNPAPPPFPDWSRWAPTTRLNHPTDAEAARAI